MPIPSGSWHEEMVVKFYSSLLGSSSNKNNNNSSTKAPKEINLKQSDLKLFG